ncbi:MAG: polysaccharide deacetylase family protein [Terriglobales bacterium]
MLPLLAGGAVAAMALAGYHSMAPRSQVFGETFIGTPGQGKQLALTFDDGPNDPYTLQLLDLLAKHEVKATFFVIGSFVEERPKIVQRMFAEGHEVGNHTYSHPVLSLCDRGNVQDELSRCGEALKHVGITNAKLFRPPFGARRPATLRIAREMGYIPVMWSVTCYDWKATSAEQVEAHTVRGITGGDVILLHDGGHKRMGTDRSHTVEATDRIIRRYKEQGFEFVTVSAMMGAAPLGLDVVSPPTQP